MSGTCNMQKFPGPLAVGSGKFLDLTSNISTVKLTTEDNGKIIRLGGTGTSIVVPDATTHAGMEVTFVVSAVFATDYVISNGGAGTFEGCVLEAGVVQDINAADTLTLEDGAENIGDTYTLLCDGTSWLVGGSSLNAASITPA